MQTAEKLITENLDVWTSAVKAKSSAGKGSGKKRELYGIQKLRGLILELAVRGLLVPQDPRDEPASDLLKKIEQEKVRLIKEGKLKKKKIPSLSDEEKAFALPPNWEWERFGTIASHNAGKTLDRGRNTGELRRYLTTSNLYWGRFDLSNVREMPITDDQLEKCTAKKGDLLICEGGEAGRSAVWKEDQDICFQNHVHRARLYGNIDPFYGYRFFESLNASGEISKYRKGVGISNMSGKALSSIPVPLPPLAEQHRIVAKVDELMALCDQLEQEQESSLDTHDTLVATLLGALTTATTDASQFAEAWQRIQAKFDTLFTTESSIDQLKQTILQLAVMGKLVPQDSKELQAEILLKNITNEKAKLIKIGGIRKTKALPGLGAEDIPFQLPSSWTWQRLGNLTSVLGDGIHGTPEYDPQGQYFFINGNNLSDGRIEIKPETKRVSRKEYEAHKKPLGKTTVLVSINGTIGRVAFYDNEKVMLGKSACYFNLLGAISLFYTKALIQTDYFLEYALSKATGSTIKNVSLKAIREFPFPLPPLAEQHRIVAKVDELMALCDQLKERLATAQTTQLNLADSLVEQAIG